MESLADLGNLKTGEEVRYKVNRMSTGALLRGRQERELDKFWRKEQFCWRDFYKDEQLFIFAHGYDSDKIGCALFPFSWMRFDNGELLIEEPSYDLRDIKKKDWAYGFTCGDRGYPTLFKALCAKTPSEKEIEDFRNTGLYASIFK